MNSRTLAACAALCLATPACAAGVLPTDEPDSGPAPQKDAGAPDTRRDTGAIPYDSGTADTWTPPDTGPTCSRTIEYGTAQCDSCMESSCCSQDNACGNSQACGDFITCVDACYVDSGNPQSCMNDCSNNYPQGASLFGAVSSCMQTSCGNDCR